MAEQETWMKKWGWIVIALVIVMIILGLLWRSQHVRIGNQTPTAPVASATPTIQNSALVDFAQYLTNQGVKLYGSPECPNCDEQRQLFGDGFARINFIDCTVDQSLCEQAGIEAYPTWVIGDKQYIGVQTIDELKKISNYKP